MANEILTMVVKTYSDAVTTANALAERIAAASKDSKALVHELRNDPNTTDPEIKAHQEWLEKAQARIEEKIAEMDAKILESLKDRQTEDVDALKAEYATAKTNATTAHKFAATIPGVSEDEIKEALKDVPELKSLRGGSTGGGTGSKRPRLERVSFSTDNGNTYTEITEDVKNAKTGEVETKVNFTIVARRLAKDLGSKVEVKDLQTAAFEAAKTDDLSATNGKPFEFAYSVGEKNVFLRVQAKTEAEETKPEDETK